MSSALRKNLPVVGLIALACVVALVGFFVAVNPERAKAHKLDSSIANEQTSLAALQVGSNRLPSVRAAELFQLARAMPNGDDMPGILVDLSRAARAASLKIVSITPAAHVALADGSSAVPLSVVVDGDWPGLSRFLRALRDQVSVHGDRLTVGGRLFVAFGVDVALATGRSKIEATLSLNAFDYGVPAPPAGTTTGTTTTTPPPSSSSAQAAGAPGSGG